MTPAMRARLQQLLDNETRDVTEADLIRQAIREYLDRQEDITGSRAHFRKSFQARIDDPTKRWKLSPMDLQSRARWMEYSKAKDEMFAYTDIKQAPWYVVNADNKQCARLNCIRHLLQMIPYDDLTPEPITLPPRQKKKGYMRPPLTDQTFVPEVYRPLIDSEGE